VIVLDQEQSMACVIRASLVATLADQVAAEPGVAPPPVEAVEKARGIRGRTPRERDGIAAAEALGRK